MNIQNTSLFYNELVSCGLSISGCDSSGNVHFLAPDENNIGPLVLAAHEQPLTSDECLALQAVLAPEQWTSYVNARNAPIKQARSERYKNETDPLFMKCFESASVIEDGDYYDCRVAKTDFDGWKQAKEAVRLELPYSL